MITLSVAFVDIYIGLGLTLNAFQEIFKRRLESFYKATAPLLSYYASNEGPACPKVVTLRGKTSDEIWPHLDAILLNEFRLKPKRTASIHEAVIRTVEGEAKRGSLEAARL